MQGTCIAGHSHCHIDTNMNSYTSTTVLFLVPSIAPSSSGRCALSPTRAKSLHLLGTTIHFRCSWTPDSRICQL
ncbi:hypothetical protein K470DRAFT_8316 [Piedraia hortae CBS 480.64]|uniref:Uncharacterized protein n=1 Tax=Piedraia hortae CBS 480.64 TaxID=1314780 RepID=A0A6A7C5R9_9PEZI|nr:hypothetical protein K470DRAFT_8316 [Piedraia hortae CBS 480.64]